MHLIEYYFYNKYKQHLNKVSMLNMKILEQQRKVMFCTIVNQGTEDHLKNNYFVLMLFP